MVALPLGRGSLALARVCHQLIVCYYLTQVDDILGDILGLEQVETGDDHDLGMLLQLSSTVPHNLDSVGSLPEHLTQQFTSVSAPAESDVSVWQKDRQKKDNHNQSKQKRCQW